LAVLLVILTAGGVRAEISPAAKEEIRELTKKALEVLEKIQAVAGGQRKSAHSQDL
jgi:hypothetical protein